MMRSLASAMGRGLRPLVSAPAASQRAPLHSSAAQALGEDYEREESPQIEAIVRENRARSKRAQVRRTIGFWRRGWAVHGAGAWAGHWSMLPGPWSWLRPQASSSLHTLL